MISKAIVQQGISMPRKLLSVAARYALGTITHVSTRAPMAALTFDDGPHPEFTARLLTILARHGARGTFFMLGKRAQESPNLVQEMAQTGHAIGNHSWDHPSFPLIAGHERRWQIHACQSAIAPYGLPLFRPPYGEQSLCSRLTALRLGYKVVAWNIEVGDWWNPNAQHMADQLVSRLTPGSIILLHDALVIHPSATLMPKLTRQPLADREPMLAAVDMFLERIGHRFQFVTVPELFRLGPSQRRNWYRTTRTS